VQDRDQGIVHVISPELGIVLPGLTLIAPDSHTCTQGALGALAWGIGTSEAEHAMATGTLRMTKPRSMRVSFRGRLACGVTAKDMNLALIARYGSAGGSGAVIEYAGDAVTALDIEGRLTLCNMATEFAATTALVAPDAKISTISKAAATLLPAPRGSVRGSIGSSFAPTMAPSSTPSWSSMQAPSSRW
jgi:3-isopropylmalate/(R)-2-methylmalate dehydratase large subunit